MTRLPAVAVLMLVVLAGTGCNDDGASKAAGRLTVDGRAEISTVEGDRVSVTRPRTLQSGDQVRMLDGTSVLSLGNGRQLELRKGSVVRLGAAAAASGEAEPRGELMSGDVLVIATSDPATVVVGSTEVTVTTGAARITRGLAVVTAVYEGAAGVESSGRSASVPALRQVSVPAPGLPSSPTPLVYSPSDSWDQRFLGDAMELSNQLLARSRGFSAQLAAGEGTTPGFYRQLLPALEREPFNASLLEPARSPGETLVGAAIVLAGGEDTFANRWANVFAFHSDGAPWGLVAIEQKAPRSTVLTVLDAAIARRTGTSELAAPSGTTATTVPAGNVSAPVVTTVPPSSGGGSAGGGSSGGTAPSGTGAPGAPATTVPGASPANAGQPTTAPAGTGTTPSSGPVPGSDRGPVDLGVPLVDDTLNGVIDVLSGLLGSLGK